MVGIFGHLAYWWQRLEHADPRTYVGRGKLQEAHARAVAAHADLVIVDDELPPNVQRSMEEILDRRVVDRTLLILDMYRETIEHPASIPDPIKRHLDLTSGHDRGRLYEILPKEFKRRAAPNLSQASNEQLVSSLADADAWWRETAQRLSDTVFALEEVTDIRKMRPLLQRG